MVMSNLEWRGRGVLDLMEVGVGERDRSGRRQWLWVAGRGTWIKRLHSVKTIGAGQRVGVMFRMATDVVHMGVGLLEVIVGAFDVT